MTERKADLSAEHVRSLFRYDCETGKVYRHDGKEAGTTNGQGYRQISIKSKIYPTHRLAWLMAYGAWPSGDIDHINGDRQDNRLCNLRDVSHSRNLFNRRAHASHNKARLLGVSPHKNKWRAHLGKRYLGLFGTPEAAHAAYLTAKMEAHLG